MQLNKLLEPKQRSLGKGERVQKIPKNIIGIQDMDGIRGFSSRLKNRVSETSTPQGGQSPRGRPRTPPEPQRQFKQFKVYDETPSGRPLPTLQQIRQANLRKIFEEKRVWTHLAIFVAILAMIIETALKKPIVNPKMLGRTPLREGIPGADVQIVTFLIQAYVLVHGVINWVT